MKIPRLPATPRIISLQLQGNRKFTTQPFLLFMFLIVISINQHIKANMSYVIRVVCRRTLWRKTFCRPSLNFCTLIFAKVPMVMYTRQEIVIGVDIGATLVLQSVGGVKSYSLRLIRIKKYRSFWKGESMISEDLTSRSIHISDHHNQVQVI